MSQRKIGTFSLCCMMIGAVLGSGIIILPPLAIEIAGPWAVPAWGLTAVFGIAFAYVFAHIGTLFPGEGGAASAVERAFGPGAKRLAAYALSGAALFGPAAVMLTIVEYFPPELAPQTSLGRWASAGSVQIVCAMLLMSGLKNMSRVTLVLATTATTLLLVGAGMALFFDATPPAPLPVIEGNTMGYTLLLLFWAVVGWEVVGNYGAEVVNPRRTVPRAAVIAALVIGLVSVAVAAGLQYGSFPDSAGHGVAALLYPLFGSFAPWVMAGLVAGLCVTTYLMFVGGVVRLVAHLAEQGGMPAFLDQRNRHNVPWLVVIGYTVVHLCQISLASLEMLDIAGILAISDGFFLANALLGTLAAVRLFSAPLPRLTAALLSVGVFLIFIQSHWQVLAVIGFLVVCVGYGAHRRRVVNQAA